MDPELEQLLALNDQDTPPAAVDVPPDPALDPELDQLLAMNDSDAPTPAAQPTQPPARANVLNPQGQLVSIPREGLDEALRNGYRLDTSEVDFTQPVTLREGDRVNTYAPDDPALTERLSAGALLATPEEVEEEYSDIPSMLATGAEGVARGATFGLSDLAADAIGGASYEAERRLREETNPGTALAGEIAGAVAPALLSGGAGAAGTAARLTPAGKLASLGERLGSKLVAKAGTTAGRVGAYAVIGAGEGAIDNAIRTVTDDLAAGNVDITAERMASAAWDGALYGGLIGGAVGGAIEGVGAVTARRARRATDQITEVADDLTPTPVPDDARLAARSVDDIDSDLRAAQARMSDADEMADPAVREEAESVVNELFAEKDAAVLRQQGIKADADVDLALSVEAPEEARGIFDRMAKSLRQAKDAKELARKFDDEVERIGRSLVSELDDQQRSWQNTISNKISRNHKHRAAQLAFDAKPAQFGQQQAQRVLDHIDERLRTIAKLRDEYSLGDDLAKKQLGKLKPAEQALEGAREYITGVKGAGPISPNSPLLRGDRDAVVKVFMALDDTKAMTGRVAKPRGSVMSRAEAALQRGYMQDRALLQDDMWGGIADMQTVTNAVESKTIGANHVFHERFGANRRLLAEHAGEHGFEGLAEIDNAAIEGLMRKAGEFSNDKVERDFIRGLERRIELAETKAKYYGLDDKTKQLIQNERARVEGIKQQFREIKILKQQRDAAVRAAEDGSPIEQAIQLLEKVGGGIGLNIVGSAARGAMNAVSGAVEALGRGAVKIERAVDNAATKAVKTLTAPANTNARLIAARAVAATAPTPAMIKRAIEDARAIADAQSEANQNMRAQLSEVAQESPELAAAVEQKAMSKAEFILSKLPPLDDSDPFMPGFERPMDRVTEAKVGRYIAAARNPRGALERLAAGTGTPEDKETLTTLYPELYRRFGEQVMRKAIKQKVPPTIKQRQALQYATGLSFAPWQTADFMMFAQPQEQPEEEESSLEPMVTPGRVKTEFKADQVYGSRADQIMNPEW